MESIRVTRINNRFHARLFVGSQLYDEMACREKQDIGYICREMLRWYDKSGGSKWSSSSRNRRGNDIPIDKIWYRKDL